jgi:DNA repair protein RecO (recombination protein O)
VYAKKEGQGLLFYLTKIRYDQSMATYKTKGIIIKRRDLGEADRILTIFTNEYGKISVVAKGVRKTLSKLGGHLELFYKVDLILAEGKSMDLVTSVTIVDDYNNIRGDLNKITACHHIAEIVDRLLGDSQDNFEVFSLICDTLKKINHDNVLNELVLRYFELHLLTILGHRPEVEKCVRSGNNLSSEKNFFCYNLGGVVHCEHLKPDDVSQEVSKNFIKVVRLLLNSNMDIVDVIKSNNILDQETQSILNHILEQLLERELKSIKFLNC